MASKMWFFKIGETMETLFNFMSCHFQSFVLLSIMSGFAFMWDHFYISPQSNSKLHGKSINFFKRIATPNNIRLCTFFGWLKIEFKKPESYCRAYLLHIGKKTQWVENEEARTKSTLNSFTLFY